VKKQHKNIAYIKKIINKENIDMSEIGDFFMKELENYKKEML